MPSLAPLRASDMTIYEWRYGETYPGVLHHPTGRQEREGRLRDGALYGLAGSLETTGNVANRAQWMSTYLTLDELYDAHHGPRPTVPTTNEVAEIEAMKRFLQQYLSSRGLWPVLRSKNMREFCNFANLQFYNGRRKGG